ncbi:unnamed protein product [Protopolystoma xenopodis]|uniref:Uncharacterized protein n=1 Tax=Protopolystoma xenopodis TaxID=117903 RepID=A0A448WH06_9PLAT|nr:unnamed protein product [Protopolystoma xenopodis]
MPLSPSEWNGLPGGYLIESQLLDLEAGTGTEIVPIRNVSKQAESLTVFTNSGHLRIFAVRVDQPGQQTLLLDNLQPNARYQFDIRAFSLASSNTCQRAQVAGLSGTCTQKKSETGDIFRPKPRLADRLLPESALISESSAACALQRGSFSESWNRSESPHARTFKSNVSDLFAPHPACRIFETWEAGPIKAPMAVRVTVIGLDEVIVWWHDLTPDAWRADPLGFQVRHFNWDQPPTS